MRPIPLFVATFVLTCLAALPGETHADELDDLDVTMEVIDDTGDAGLAIADMGLPESADVDSAHRKDSTGEDVVKDSRHGDQTDGTFEHDEDFDDEKLDEEHEFEHEEGEDVDDDLYDEEDDAGVAGDDVT